MTQRPLALAALLVAAGTTFAQSAVLFDGTSGYGVVPDHATYDLSGDFTLEAEVVFDSLALSRQSAIISKMAAWNVENVYLEYSSPEGQRLAFGGRGGGVEWLAQYPFVPLLGQCYHVAGVRNGDDFSLYLDGALVGHQHLENVGDPSNPGDWLIEQVLNSIRWFPGKIDEVRVWSTARSQVDIIKNMFTRVPGDAPGLMACWRFDEGQGTMFADASPTANPGQLQGGFSWTADECPEPDGTPAVALDFWLHRRTNTFSGVTAGVTDGPFSPATRTSRVWLGMHNGDMLWHLRMYDGNQALVDQVMDWPGDRWIHVRVEHHATGLWRTLWDLADSLMPDQSMALAWSPVTQTICGEPATPDGYVVLYSERSAYDDADYYFLSFVNEPGFLHNRVAAFSTNMYYRVHAWSGATLDWEHLPARTTLADLRRLAEEASH